MASFKPGDKVKVIHPTGGVTREDIFTVVHPPQHRSDRGQVFVVLWTTGDDWRPWVRAARPLGFDPSSLEPVAEDVQS